MQGINNQSFGLGFGLHKIANKAGFVCDPGWSTTVGRENLNGELRTVCAWGRGRERRGCGG